MEPVHLAAAGSTRVNSFDTWDKAGLAFVLAALALIALFLIATSLRKTRRNIGRSYRRALKPVRDERSSITRHNDIIGRDFKTR
jgi:hypothetical protein